MLFFSLLANSEKGIGGDDSLFRISLELDSGSSGKNEERRSLLDFGLVSKSLEML